MNIPGYTLIGPLAYRGKKDCASGTCTRQYLDGKASEDCFGWHCSYCDEPCSSQGHRCDAAEAILGEARRQADSEPCSCCDGEGCVYCTLADSQEDKT